MSKRHAKTQDPDNDAASSASTEILLDGMCCMCGIKAAEVSCTGMEHSIVNRGMCRECEDENGNGESCCKRCAVFHTCSECDDTKVFVCRSCGARVCSCMPGDEEGDINKCNKCESHPTYPCAGCNADSTISTICPACGSEACVTCADAYTGVCAKCYKGVKGEIVTVDSCVCRCCSKETTQMCKGTNGALCCVDCSTVHGLDAAFDSAYTSWQD